MSTTSEAGRPPVPKGQRWFWASMGLFGIVSVIRGIDRLADGHPLSGWIMLASGAAMALGVAQMFWRLRRSPS